MDDCAGSVALYGLILFYSAVKQSEHMEGKRPLAKFLCIKLIVMFTFYQSLLVSRLWCLLLSVSLSNALAEADGHDYSSISSKGG